MQARNFFGSNYDFTVRIHLIGEAGAGKSNLLQRLCYDVFPEIHTEPTSLPRSVEKKLGGVKVKMNLWDIPPDRFIFDPRYYIKTNAVLVIYDRTKDLLANKDEFIAMVKEHQKNYTADAKYVLVGTKSDAEDLRWSANDEAIHDLAMQVGVRGFIDVSAKTGLHMDHLPINILSNLMPVSYRHDVATPAYATI